MVECVCEQCRQVFQLPLWRMRRPGRKFCSRSCKDASLVGQRSHKYRKVTVQCAACGTSLTRSPSLVRDRKQVFCSKSCCNTWRREHGPRGQSIHNYNSVVVSCDACGAQVTQPRSQADTTKHHFCNQRCKGVWQREHLRGSHNPAYKASTITVSCAYCGRECARNSFKRQRNNLCFCTHQCYGKWRIGRFTEAANPYWKGGRSYTRGPNWKRRSKMARERDGHRCQICGSSEQLHVHHIIPFDHFGYVQGENENYKQANALSNLITLCASCHGRVERGGLELPSR